MDEPKLDRRFVVDLKGKSYPLFAGVLDLAHQSGLLGITNELIQAPTAANDNVAIVKATVRLEGGKEFSAYGDASPANTARHIATALIRMAETRAKGRALRDAVNVGDCLLEELPDLEEDRAEKWQREMPPEKFGAKKAEVAGAQSERPKAKYEPGTVEGEAAMAGSKKPAQSGMTALGDVNVAKCDVCKLAMTAGQVTYCEQNKISPPVHLSCARRGA